MNPRQMRRDAAKSGRHETVLQRQSLTLPVEARLKLVICLEKISAIRDHSGGLLSLTHPVTEVLITDRKLELIHLLSLSWICLLFQWHPAYNKLLVKQALRLRIARPMCDGRPFASSPFRRLASGGLSLRCGILFMLVAIVTCLLFVQPSFPT